jgi:hypothetical protein
MNVFTKSLSIAAFGVAAFSSVQAAQAQTATAGEIVLPTSGTKEIGLAGSYHFNTPKFYSAQILLGYFTSPTLEVGGQLGVSGADGTSAATNISAFVDYYLANGSSSVLLPYVGLTVGYEHFSGQDSTSIGGEVGAKYFLNSNVAVNAKFQYVGAKHITGQSDFIIGLSTFIK